jgi:tetratricopeptide (TPR) repeat protein
MDDKQHTNGPTRNRHRQWTANPSEQWAFALDHMDVGEWDLAISHCRRALEIWPTYYDALLLMSGAYQNKGDLDSALEAVERASEIAAQELGQAWNNLAALHLERKEYDEVITIDRVLSLVDPSRVPLTSYRMGIAYTALGDVDSGERWLREAIEHRPDLFERALGEPLLKPITAGCGRKNTCCSGAAENGSASRNAIGPLVGLGKHRARRLLAGAAITIRTRSTGSAQQSRTDHRGVVGHRAGLCARLCTVRCADRTGRTPGGHARRRPG